MSDTRVQRAVQLFMQGYGCCQSVVAAYADLYGFTERQALLLSAGFGGGIGRMRMTCGAVSALVILAGMHSGQTEGADREGKARCYRHVQQLIERSKQQNGSIICAELLGLKAASQVGSPIPSERTPQYYRQRPCAAKVENAARLFAQFLAENPIPHNT